MLSVNKSPLKRSKFWELINSLKIPPVQGFILPNHDTGRILPAELQRNTTNPSVVFFDSSATDYDSADESSSEALNKLHRNLFLPLKELRCSTRGIKFSASKTNLAHAGKLKNVKMEDDPPLAIVMKELNELKLQINKKKSSYSRNKNAQQCKRTNHKTYDHVDFMFSMNANQHHNGQGESSSRSRPIRPSVSFPSCIHCGHNDHHSNDCLHHPTCEICRSYDHDTYGHNSIISLRRGINPRNPQHVTKNYETCGRNVYTTSDHNDIEWFRKSETLQAKNAESFKARKNESSSALRSKTPTKSFQKECSNSMLGIKGFYNLMLLVQVCADVED
ncbi:hypothetical protein Tco_1568068 [Tanacetum coccineum]